MRKRSYGCGPGRRWRAIWVGALVVAVFAGRDVWAQQASAAVEELRGEVRCANLIYANNKTSKCFSEEFLAELGRDSLVNTHIRFVPVQADAPDLCRYPFAVMTGEGRFALTESQRESLRYYLLNGAFLVASAGCSNSEWSESFIREMKLVLPDMPLKKLALDHPVFHTVYEITQVIPQRASARPELQAIEIEGRIALVFSPDGLNDSDKAGGNCCCCGGSEIKNARQINANLLAYALTR